MQRRGSSGHPVKGQRTTRPKARKASTAQRSTDHSTEQFDRLKRERDGAREQLAAMADILRVIRASPTDAQPVFETIVRNAVSLCGGLFANVFTFDGELLHYVASHNVGPSYADMIRVNYPMRPDSSQVSGRVVLAKSVVWLEDALADPDYDQRYPRAMGWRRLLGVPMLHEGNPIGAITVGWAESGPPTKVQEELLKTFADQAVIAIENVRLFEAEQKRRRELSESLEQQTATSEVLKVISSSPSELKPVFDAILENATRICEAKFGTMWLREGDAFRVVALHNAPPAYEERRRNRLIHLVDLHPKSAFSRFLTTRQVTHIADIRMDQGYLNDAPTTVEVADAAGARTVLMVPMLKDNELVGSITIYRQEVRPFTDKQIELVKNFAAQAVIAVENTRLLNELRESLQQQTATADVLKVISRSTFDLQPVLNTLTESAARLCEAHDSSIFLRQGESLRHRAHHGPIPQDLADLPIGRGFVNGRAFVDRAPVHVHDLQVSAHEFPDGSKAALRLGHRTVLAVPLLREDEAIGTLQIRRTEVKPFTDKQMELVRTFAAQAVIAIENVRLFDEVQARTRELSESLEQQTATSKVLQVISSSPGELEPVFDAMLANATRICEAKFGTLYLRDDDGFRAVAATRDAPPAYVEARKRELRLQPPQGGVLGRAAVTKQVVHIADITKLQTYLDGHPWSVGAVELGKFRTALGVPMLKDDELIGVITIMRQEVRPFSDKQIDLVKNFADQAVIAIENTRLLNEQRESLQQQTATADVLKAISRSAFDLKSVLDALVEAAARLCDADQGNIARERDGVFERVAEYGLSPAYTEYLRTQPVIPERGTAMGRALLEGKVVHISDVLADSEYTFAEGQKLSGFRTIITVPMLRDGTVIGVLGLTRREVRPFTDKQIELVTTFADQAAIAIENVRLFESVEARTRELAKSLEELRTTQDRLVQTQKLALLGQLTAGIAHEIKNPLNFVNNFSGISAELIDELQDTLKGISLDDRARTEINELTDTLKNNFDKVVHHGRRADAIVKNMLQHSREGSSEHRVIEINALVEESLNLAWHGARAETQGFEIKLKQSFDPSAGGADVFPQDIRRALLNMISNGFYAATKRRAETDGGDYEPTLSASTKDLGDRVEITIRDNGTGIKPDVKEKMFNPFFTTKPSGEGTGLGLSISHDIIVKQHGGSIEVDTQPGEFTEITVTLPRAASFI